MTARPSAEPAPSRYCYHCGLPAAADSPFHTRVDGVERAMCCAGCQAVAEAIVAGGLEAYYRHRDALPEGPAQGGDALPQALAELGLFDHPQVQKNFVRPVAEHEAEAALMLEGVTCAACVWLNETHLRRQPGVTAVEINYATRRARVRWDTRVARLSQLLEAVARIGYRAHPYDAARAEALAQKERKEALWRVFVAGFGAMQVMMNAVAVYLAEVGVDMSHDIEQLLRWASLALTLPVVLYASAPFFRNAWRDLGLRRAGMDVPVALGILTAFVASLWATFTGGGEVYYDSVTMFVFLLLGGRYLELMARQRAARGVESLTRALPALATRLPSWPAGEAETVAVADLAPGDVLRVKPGETLPADAVVIEGRSRIDESLLTGESLPCLRAPGDAVTGGTLNTESPLVLRVTQVGEATRLAAIVRLMERATAEKPRVVQLADRVAAWFVVGLLVAAAATLGLWWMVAPERALWVFVSVLVVSCPCALALATPAALTVATGAMARRGLLVTRGHAIETLARVTHVVFDKTGTLTEGRFALRGVDVLDGEESAACAAAAGLEQASEHPIAQALRQASANPQVFSCLRAVTGAGVEGVADGLRWRLGRPDFVAQLHAQTLPASWSEKLGAGGTAQTRVALGSERGWVALFELADAPRADAAQLVAALTAGGITCSVLSGDAQGTVDAVAAALGIRQARGGMSPEGKLEALRALQAGGAVVAMLGDGVNDAPVLAQAQVAVAMGAGADLARARADAVLLGERLMGFAEGLAAARRCARVVRQNLAWSVLYNALALPLAMAGWITPWMAGIGMSASSLLVVLNALRLQAPLAR